MSIPISTCLDHMFSDVVLLTNFSNTCLVFKINLETKHHLKPYKLLRLNENVKMLVNKKIEICFKIGKYEDVVPMEAGHLLLGRHWQFDRKINHDVYCNKYFVMHHSQKINLVQLNPSELRED